MSPFLLLLIAATSAEQSAATPSAEPVAQWVGALPAGEAVAPVRYDQQAIAPGPAAGAPQQDPFTKRVLALEIALSTLVAERPTLWRFDRLESEAAALLSQAPTEADRLAVRNLADRIDRFARIGARHRQARNNGDWNAPARSVASQAPDRVAPPVRLTKAPAQPRSPHDAQGVLRPVVSKRTNAPKYAVVNERGEVTTLVTPQPEVAKSFEKLVGKRVGLNGQRGFLTDLQRQHLVAERVTPLGAIRR